MSDQDGRPPHCDELVLHAPGECEICDKYAPQAQQQRITDGVNFTGHNDPNKQPCPAWVRRGANCQKWQGNAPVQSTLCKGCGRPTTFYDPCLECAFKDFDKDNP